MFMPGETSGPSQFCEFEWFKWVMFPDKMAPYQDNHHELGRYFGPSIGVGLAKTAKIIKENGQVLHRSKY